MGAGCRCRSRGCVVLDLTGMRFGNEIITSSKLDDDGGCIFAGSLRATDLFLVGPCSYIAEYLPFLIHSKVGVMLLAH